MRVIFGRINFKGRYNAGRSGKEAKLSKHVVLGAVLAQNVSCLHPIAKTDLFRLEMKTEHKLDRSKSCKLSLKSSGEKS
jgi:hypothetical protein